MPGITFNRHHTGDHAEISISTTSKTLVLTFRRRREWSLHRTELRHGEHFATLTRGHVLDAVTALLR